MPDLVEQEIMIFYYVKSLLTFADISLIYDQPERDKMNVGEKAKIEGRVDLGIVDIVDIDMGIAYVELSTGVEMEFPVNKLLDPNTQVVVKQAAWVAPELTAQWINEVIPGAIYEQASKLHTKAANVARGTPTWNNLSPEKKMNLIAAMCGARTTGIELYKNMRSGKISPITLTKMAGENLHETTFQNDQKE